MIQLPGRRWPWLLGFAMATSLALSSCSHGGLRGQPSARNGLGDATSAGASEAVPEFDVPADRYMSHITFLADDALKGRGTGDVGNELAAGYIAGQFAAAGLLPAGENGTYFQPFTVKRGAKLSDDTRLSVQGAAVTPKLGETFLPLGFSAQGPFEAPVVFAGYGAVYAGKNHDDYAGLDVTGKAVLMLRRMPEGWGRAEGESNPAMFSTKMKLAEEKGAAAVLIVNQDPGDDGEDVLMPFRVTGEPNAIPALHVSRTLADAMLQAGGQPTIAELQKKLDEGHGPASAALTGVSVQGEVKYDVTELATRNVIGLLPGTGPDKDKYIVIGGHHDHLGERRGQIHNGADDNASGTAGVIEAAHALAPLPHRDRSVLFMTYSGEEIGLLGSKHYVEHPTVPLESIVTMINLDMIGRLDEATIDNMMEVQGVGTGDSFKALLDRRSEATGMKYFLEESANGPSDHASFYKKGIPSIFFHTGLHDDYHAPGDDVEKVNAEGGAKVTEFICGVVYDLTAAPQPPKYVKVDGRANMERPGSTRAQAQGGSRVVMGIMPDMDDDSGKRGWRVAEVTPGGGAANAGMKPGDRIVRVEEKDITGFSDYREAVKDKNPGETIAVRVLRGEEELTLSVELAAR